MARTITEIQNEIIRAKEASPELNFLTSSSRVSVWRLWTYITAVAIYTHEVIFDQFRKEVNEAISARQPGTPSWYVQQLFNFQAGDTVTVVDGSISYQAVDPEKKIITRAAYKEDAGTLTLKTAKGEIGSESPLSDIEVAQAKAYLERIKFAGSEVNLVSLEGDRLRVTAEIFYNGLMDPETVRENVELALGNYMENLDFNGLVYRNKIIDAIQNVDGVIDVDITGLDGVSGETVTEITRIYETVSGYIKQDDAPNDFENLITYTAQ